MIDEANKYAVSVIVLTYNHELFIEECLENIVNQDFELPFEIILYDDNSKDLTLNLATAFLKNSDIKYKIIASKFRRYTVKYWFAKKVKELYLLSNSEFVAVCDGDDFWSHKRKLAIQYEYMRKNPNISVSHHAYRVLNQKLKVNYRIPEHLDKFDFKTVETSERLLKGNFVGSPTVMYRSFKLIKFPKYFNFYLGHVKFVYLMSKIGDIGFIPIEMATYRIHDRNGYQNLPERKQRRINNINNKILRKWIQLK